MSRSETNMHHLISLQNYEHLFKVNDKSVGGSFYLQSKVRKDATYSPPALGSIKAALIMYVHCPLGCRGKVLHSGKEQRLSELDLSPPL